jgi:hypothetical protein
LNNVHSIFGKVVGGFETLTKMEQQHTDPTVRMWMGETFETPLIASFSFSFSKDRPYKDIMIQKVMIYTNPFKEATQLSAAQKKADEEAVSRLFRK